MCKQDVLLHNENTQHDSDVHVKVNKYILSVLRLWSKSHSSFPHRRADRCTILCVCESVCVFRAPPHHSTTSTQVNIQCDCHVRYTEVTAQTAAQWSRLHTKPPVTSSKTSVGLRQTSVTKLTNINNYHRQRAAAVTRSPTLHFNVKTDMS